MGWFDGGSIISSRSSQRSHGSKHRKSSSRSHHRSRSRSRSRARPTLHHTQSTPSFFNFAMDPSSSHHPRHSSSRSDLHSIFGGGKAYHNSSRASFFSIDRSRSTKRAPRSGYIQRIYYKLRRLLRDLVRYAKRHPVKVFILVIMPLVTGGALSGLLRRFGIRLPASWEALLGTGGHSGTTVGRGDNGELRWERTSIHEEGRPRNSGVMSALGGVSSIANAMGGGAGAIGLAKLFM